MNKEKVEEILLKHSPYVFFGNAVKTELFGETVKHLTTLINQEKKEAVEGLLNKCCKECRDLVYSEYALQEQDKKTNGVEKMVREEQGK